MSVKKLLFLSAIVAAAGLVSSCEDVPPPAVSSHSPSFGPEGTLITVEGMDFEDLIAINFNNGLAADFNPSFGTTSALLFRVPADAPIEEHTVEIISETGSTSFPFRVTHLPPEILDFNPKNANEGSRVTIIGENFFEPVEVLFFDSIAGNIIHLAEDSLVVEVPAGVERGRIKVKANGGSALTAELFFSTVDILVNDFDGNGLRSDVSKWLFYGVEENAGNAVQSENPSPIDGNYLKLSGTDPGSIWIGGAENHSWDVADFQNFGIQSDINNTLISFDLNNRGRDHTHLIIVLVERDGSPNDFTRMIHVDWDDWERVEFPLNRFQDVNGASVDPSKIRAVKFHLFNELGSNLPLEVNIDNVKFIQIN